MARENFETKENQGKRKKDTELIRKLNCELGRIRKKQSALVKANESLDKDCSELRGESDKLCESNSILEEENYRLRALLDDHRTSRSELVEAKKIIRAQEAEIQNNGLGVLLRFFLRWNLLLLCDLILKDAGGKREA